MQVIYRLIWSRSSENKYFVNSKKITRSPAVLSANQNLGNILAPSLLAAPRACERGKHFVQGRPENLR